MTRKADRMKAVSCRADKVYILALRAYAYDHETSVGDLVRDILDKSIGQDLEPYRKLFRGKRGTRKFQMEATEDDEETHRYPIPA